MTVSELSILTAIGIVLAFALGFLSGIGYQQTEDRHTLNKYRDLYRKMAKEFTDVSVENVNKAYEMGRRHEKEEAARRAEIEWQELLQDVRTAADGRDKDIKFGGF